MKWRALDGLERALMVLCGVAITGFTVTVICDVVTRTLRHPWLWLQEVTMTFFIYGVFIGTAAATRRNDHLYLAVLAESMSGRKRLAFEAFNRLVVLGVAFSMIWFGYLNTLDGFRSLRDDVEERVDLLLHDAQRLAALALQERFAHAHNGKQIVLEGGRSLLGDQRIGLTE
ncbi:MAG: TRAP transporter small permease subunit, partial [Burkholderiaceae bacterium]